MFAPDDILAPAAREIGHAELLEGIEHELREDFARADRQNGRVYGGLLPVYDLLRAGSWPGKAADRDELCRRWGCGARQLYQWRRDVLFCFWIAFRRAPLPTPLPTQSQKPQ